MGEIFEVLLERRSKFHGNQIRLVSFNDTWQMKRKSHGAVAHRNKQYIAVKIKSFCSMLRHELRRQPCRKAVAQRTFHQLTPLLLGMSMGAVFFEGTKQLQVSITRSQMNSLSSGDIRVTAHGAGRGNLCKGLMPELAVMVSSAALSVIRARAGRSK